jgi:TetR/AcrR family transcriptional repressor of lmrAB and yxaGH operons|nr:TetR/AcrR family transcriptional regulator [Kofleriaceae bacterium]
MTKGEHTRDALVATTGELLRRQGYHATGLAQIVAESGAPRGSIYFHFPGGKDELATRALDAAGAAWRARIDAVIAAAPDLGAAVRAVCELLADDLAASDYQDGCPVAAVALENPSPVVRDAIAAHYERWLAAIAARAGGAQLGRGIATFVLASIEGALLLAKATRSKQPLHTVGAMLAALSSSAPGSSRPAGPRRTRRSAGRRTGRRTGPRR